MSALAMENVSKQFGGEFALRNAALEVRAGEIHGLLGANGSGKSTMIKILAGFHTPEPGAIVEVGGQTLSPPVLEADLRRLGVAFVHQDLALFSKMTVVDNLRVAELIASHRNYISWRHERRRAGQILADYGLGDVDPRAQIDTLSRTDRARLAIARAFAAATRGRSAADGASGGLVVLDEPTAFLPIAGAAELFRLMRAFASRGGAVVFVSHDLEEVREITDRVTVLRDGVVAGVRETPSVTTDDLVHLIIGRPAVRSPAAGSDSIRTLGDVPDAEPSSVAKSLASTATLAEVEAPPISESVGAPGFHPPSNGGIGVTGLCGPRIDNVSFEVAQGEILGVAGLVGSGFDDLPYLIFGASRASAGRVRIGSELYDASSLTPAKAVGMRMALVPAERPTLGVFNELSTDDNLSPTVLSVYRRHGHLRRRAMRADARRLLHDSGVTPPDAGALLNTFSGGNQQKVVMAKWTRRAPHVLILHEPTQGVDVGARQEIYRRLLATRADRCTICVSTDHDELELLCDRVVVFYRGRIVATLRGADVEKSRISEACMRVPETVAGRKGDDR